MNAAEELKQALPASVVSTGMQVEKPLALGFEGPDVHLLLDDLEPLEEVDDFFRKMVLQKGEVIYTG